MIPETIQRIKEWQACDYVHSLTCGNDSSHELLIPEYNSKDDSVQLRCPSCDYIQTNIPDAVLKVDIKELTKENKSFFGK